MADVDPAIPVIFLDTGWLFEETLAYRDTLVARSACATSVRSSRSEETLRARTPIANCGSPILTPAAASARSSRSRRALAPFRGLDQWPQALPGRLARRHSGRRGRRYPAEIQSLRQCLARRDRGDLRGGQSAAASAAGLGLSVGRMHALHQPDLAGRGCPRRAAGAAGPRPNAASILSRRRRALRYLGGIRGQNPGNPSPFSHGWYATTARHLGGT